MPSHIPSSGASAAAHAAGARLPADAAALPLSPRAASMLAYSAGWLSGLLVLALEGRRPGVRRHAAQAVVGFGLVSLLALGLLLAAGLGLFVSITLFRVLLWAAQAVVLLGVVFWLLALGQTARGADWHWPGITGWTQRLTRLGLGPDAS